MESELLILRIIKAYEAGVPVKVIAGENDVSIQYVSAIANKSGLRRNVSAKRTRKVRNVPREDREIRSRLRWHKKELKGLGIKTHDL